MIKRKILCAVLAGVMCAGMTVLTPANAEGFALKGDVNCDGEFGAADIVTFTSWLLGAPDAQIGNTDAADFCRDNRLDAFDVTLMRAALVTQQMSAKIASPACTASAFACVDDREMLYADSINERVAPASLTKLLTALTALKYLSPDTVVTVGSEQSLVNPNSSLCLIKAGHRLKLRDLLTGMLMASGNDAAYTVAVKTARAAKPDTSMTDAQAVTCFAELMNEYAASIGMSSSHFVNPDGWDDMEQYTTVSDLLILADSALKVPEIREIVGTYEKKVTFVSGEVINWKNTNKLLDKYSSFYCADAIGVKTGSTVSAGNCLVAAFERGGKTYISAVVGCETDSGRYELTQKLLALSEKDAVKSDVSEVFKMLDALDYHGVSCDGLPEYKLTAPDGTVYLLNLSAGWVWRRPSLIVEADNEAPLTAEVISAVKANWDSLDIEKTAHI